MPRKAETPAVEPVRIGGRIVSYRPAAQSAPETPAAPAVDQPAALPALKPQEA